MSQSPDKTTNILPLIDRKPTQKHLHYLNKPSLASRTPPQFTRGQSSSPGLVHPGLLSLSGADPLPIVPGMWDVAIVCRRRVIRLWTRHHVPPHRGVGVAACWTLRTLDETARFIIWFFTSNRSFNSKKASNYRLETTAIWYNRLAVVVTRITVVMTRLKRMSNNLQCLCV